jgi:hypothetical protein
MANPLYLLGKRIIISKSRGCVRGSVIFLLTHLLLIIGIVFGVEMALVVFGALDIHIPIAGRLFSLIPLVP